MQSAKRAAHRSRDTCVQSAKAVKVAPSAPDLQEEEEGVYRVRGLAHCDVLRVKLEQERSERLRRDGDRRTTAAASHLMQHGHELAFGCCRPAA